MTFADDLEITGRSLADYLAASLSREAPVFRQPPMVKLAEQLDIAGQIKSGGLHGNRLKSFLDIYLAHATRLQHPASMGHQVAVPHPSGILGALIDAFTNNPMAIYEMGAAAATVDYAMINWMLEKIGWQPAPYPGSGMEKAEFGGGLLTHGGSLAQLTALAAARSSADPDAWENGNSNNLVVIAPSDSHYSVARALGILGLGRKALVSSPCDSHGRIIPDLLDDTIRMTRESGRKIMAVIANACSTAAGLYDDLTAIGEICRNHNVWLHVDGAHGASALLSRQHRHRLKGIELATSVIWDAHKMLRTPGLCAAVLFRDHCHIDHAFEQEASYIFHDKEQTGFDSISRTIECTKAGIGLKFFMGLASEGEAGLAKYIDSRYALAEEAAGYISDHPDFEIAVRPQANIVCFRLKNLDDETQLNLRKAILATGESYITSTMFAGRRWLRFTFMNPDSTMEDVRHTLDLLLGAGRLGNREDTI